jgi:hypothetical protein
MKLHEVLDDKTEDAKKLVKLLRKKANRANPRAPKQNKHNIRGAEDSFTGYSLDTFAQTTWD